MLYSSFDESMVKGIVEGFMKKYPKIKAEGFRASVSPLIAKIQTEYRAGKHTLDAFLGSAPSLIRAELRMGDLVAPYDSPEAKVFPPELKDPQGLWTATQYSPQAIGYNTELVKGADIPQTYWDLLKPTFKDKIEMYQPTVSPHAMVISKRKIIGPDRWMEFLNGLKAQNAKDIRGASPIVTMLKQGEVCVTLWSYTGTLRGHSARESG